LLKKKELKYACSLLCMYMLMGIVICWNLAGQRTRSQFWDSPTARVCTGRNVRSCLPCSWVGWKRKVRSTSRLLSTTWTRAFLTSI